MATLATRSNALVAATLGACLVLGAVAGINAKYAVLGAFGLVFVVLVLDDLMLGVLLMCVLAFVDTLPTSGALSPSKVVGALLVVSWLGYMTSHRDEPTLMRARPGYVAVLALFLAWAIFSIVWADPQGAAVNSVTRYAPNLLLVGVLYTAVRSPRDAVRVLAVIGIAAWLSAMVGIVHPPPDPSTIGDPSRATSTVGDANELAAALDVGLIVSASFAINRGFSAATRLAFGAFIPICLVAILLTLSRGGLLALGAALIAAVVFSGRRFRGRAIGLACVVGGAAAFYFSFVAPPAARERVMQAGNGTGRVDLWTVAWRMVQAHPLNGVGAGGFKENSIHYLLRPGVIQRDDFIISSSPLVTHNTYLQVLAELGIVGEALFAVILAASIGSLYLAVRSFTRQGDERMEILARGLLIAVIGWLTAIIFISEMYSKLFWLMLGMGPALHALARAREGVGARAAAGRAPALARP